MQFSNKFLLNLSEPSAHQTLQLKSQNVWFKIRRGRGYAEAHADQVEQLRWSDWVLNTPAILYVMKLYAQTFCLVT